MPKLKNIKNTDRFKKGIYLLPNLFTTAGLFAGFYAIVAAVNHLYEVAPIAIFIAMLMDSLDGRIARLTNTVSAFGAQYDSLADVIAFGVAPAVCAYSWGLHSLGKIGWLIAFFYASATALRLARFNIQIGTEKADKKYFQGLACTAAAGFVAGTIWVQHLYNLQQGGMLVTILTAIVTALAAILMVSNIRYRSFKDHDFKSHVPFFAILIMVLIFVSIALDPPDVLCIGFVVYVFSGPIEFLIRKIRKIQY
ncbi:MAG: CDP-diacylglycerol--serine O-phosphatidyltransferase [Gammaproteobacteria bacterium]|nr:CDP-diacylglycerol--serine O-phosphatidyltransferase [Gammaproteobacteria bacterium]